MKLKCTLRTHCFFQLRRNGLNRNEKKESTFLIITQVLLVLVLGLVMNKQTYAQIPPPDASGFQESDEGYGRLDVIYPYNPVSNQGSTQTNSTSDPNDIEQFWDFTNGQLVNKIYEMDLLRTQSMLFTTEHSSHMRAFYSDANVGYVANELKTIASRWNGADTIPLTKMYNLAHYLRGADFYNYYDPELAEYSTGTYEKISDMFDQICNYSYHIFFNWSQDNKPTFLHAYLLDELFILSRHEANYFTYNMINISKIVLSKLSDMSKYSSYSDLDKRLRDLVKTTLRGHFNGFLEIQGMPYASMNTTDWRIEMQDYVHANINFAINNPQFRLHLINSLVELSRYLDAEQVGDEVVEDVTSFFISLVDTYNLGTENGEFIYAKIGSIIEEHIPDSAVAASTQNWKDDVMYSYHNITNTLNLPGGELIKFYGNRHMTYADLTKLKTLFNLARGHFHDITGTDALLPIPNDLNDTLEVYIYESETDYHSYANTLFGISTNNGGLYLEKESEVDGNIARLFFYGFRSDSGEWQHWNGTHEFVHYLDGRFVKKGDYIWNGPIAYIEGLADYIEKDLIYSNPENVVIADYATRFLRKVIDTRGYAVTSTLPEVMLLNNNNNVTLTYTVSPVMMRYLHRERPQAIKNIVNLYRTTETSNISAIFNLINAETAHLGRDFYDWIHGETVQNNAIYTIRNIKNEKFMYVPDNALHSVPIEQQSGYNQERNKRFELVLNNIDYLDKYDCGLGNKFTIQPYYLENMYFDSDQEENSQLIQDDEDLESAGQIWKLYHTNDGYVAIGSGYEDSNLFLSSIEGSDEIFLKPADFNDEHQKWSFVNTYTTKSAIAATLDIHPLNDNLNDDSKEELVVVRTSAYSAIVRFISNKGGSARLIVTDQNGGIIHSEKIYLHNSRNEIQIQLPSTSQTYIVRLITNEGAKFSKKISVVKVS